MRHKLKYLQRTIPDIAELFQPLEEIIQQRFIPALLGGQLMSGAERLLLSLPAKYGGFSIDNPVTTCEENHEASTSLSQQLTMQLQKQQTALDIKKAQQLDTQRIIQSSREEKLKGKLSHWTECLPGDKLRAMACSQEKGASAFVTTLPLQKYGFILSKMEFRDQLLMRYRWPLQGLPTTCACGRPLIWTTPRFVIWEDSSI